MNSAHFCQSLLLIFFCLTSSIASSAFAEPQLNAPEKKEAEKKEAEKIEDNSFFLEEAYNQEPGVVQFIQGAQYLTHSKSFSYSFTNEIPITDETHQFSYTIPVNSLSGDSRLNGIGDVLLNYRYQLMKREGLAMAPRLSIILPTGKYQEGMGAGAFGLQFNHAVSIEISKNWVSHWNLGFTLTPDAREPGGARATTFGTGFGASAIYLASNTFNLMLEVFGASGEVVTAEAVTERADSLFISPGFRFAINMPSGLQIVPGLALPIGIGPSAKELGVYGYLSFENKLW